MPPEIITEPPLPEMSFAESPIHNTGKGKHPSDNEHKRGALTCFLRKFLIFACALQLTVALQAQATPPQDFINACAIQRSNAEADCVRNAPTDVPPQAHARFLNMCRVKGEQGYSRCIASFVHNEFTGYVDFMLLGILYAPPGNASFASVGNSTQTGTTYGVSANFTVTDTVSWDVSAGFLGNGVSVGASDTNANGTGHSDQKTITSTTSDNENVHSVFNPGDSDQRTLHDGDAFLLWVHPMINLVEGPLAGQIHTTTTVGPGESINLVWVTAGQLRRLNFPPDRLADQLVTVPGQPGLTRTGLHVLTASDATAILAQDMLISAPPDQPLSSSGYFRYIRSQPLEGPDSAGNLSAQFTISNSISETVTQTQTQARSSAFTAEIHEATPIQSARFNFSNGWSWTTTTSDALTHGYTSSATVQLASSTRHCCGITPDVQCTVDIYEDLTWHSFAFVPERSCLPFRPLAPTAAGIHALGAASNAHPAGIVSTRNGPSSVPFAMQGKVIRHGAPALGVEVAIYAADSQLIYRTLTDHTGRFTAADLPAGQLSVEVGDKTYPVIITHGQTTTLEVLVK